MNISAKGLEEDKNHFGVFLRFLLHRPENMFINRDYDNFISTDFRQRKVSGGGRFQVSGFKIQGVSGFMGFQVSGFKFQVSGFRFQVSGFRFQGAT